MDRVLSEFKVLIVDDTETNIDILVDTLESDYEISVAMDGKSALECIDLDKPDIVLLDIMMPEMDGYETCEKIKSNDITKDIPVIFLTAITDIDSKTRGFEMGAVDYITKPFEILEVRSRVKTHLALKLANQQLADQKYILEDKVIERTKEISLTQEVTIEAIASLAEYRDPETGGHINRTKNYVKIMAERLMQKQEYEDILNDKIVEMYYKSAPLHDIGKIGVKDEILLKPGKLTSSEFEEMKMHTMFGTNVLAMSSKKLGENSFLKYAMEFSKYHHEKWDGTGYPQGLKGKNIPLTGRIMAIADVYDALISKRVYKPAFSHERAVEIIREDSGSHFDPELVELFLQISEDFRDIAQKYLDE